MTHIDLFVRKKERNSATSHLEIANRFALLVDIPFLNFFLLSSHLFSLFIPCFSDFSCRLKGFRALSGIRSPKTGFGCSFIAAPLSLLLFFASPVCTLILLLCIFFSFSCSSGLLCWFLKAQMGWNESFSL